MTQSKFLAAASLFFILIVFYVFAAEEPFRIRSFSNDQSGEVSVVVELPAGLTPKTADFDLLIDNKIVATAREIRGLDLNVMFFVDVSGSMKGSKNDSPLEDAKNALSSFLTNPKIRPQDQFALTSFADNDTLLASSREEVSKSVKTLKPVGKTTRLYQAVDNALKKSPKDDPRTRQIFVVISDGKDEDEQSEDKHRQLMADSKASLVPIYTVFRGKTEPPFKLVLSELANAAGARFFLARNEIEITDALKQIYGLETSSLLVKFSYHRDNPERTTKDAAIKLRRPDGSALTAEFPGAIPVPLTPSPPPPPPLAPRPWLLWLIAAVILSGGAVWIWRRSRHPTEVTDTSAVIEDIVETTPITPPPPIPRHRATTVIAQYFPVPTAGQPNVMLRGVTGPVEGQQHGVDKDIYSIGANETNDLSIGNDEYISSEHAYLRYEKGSLFIFDKASRNGTFVNDDKVTQSGVALRQGDRIKLGRSIFEVVMPSG
jgi:Mg-chelatase subunit ChlD